MSISDNSLRIDTPDYWADRYASGQTGWDMKDETPVFYGIRQRGEFPMPAVQHGRRTTLFIPGCGYGHDALAFARAGYAVTAVDFAAAPLQVLRQNAAYGNLDIDVVQADIFDLPASRFTGTFDTVLEYTCYCALLPEHRAEYTRILARSLAPGGWVVALLFPTDGRSGGPPFAVDPAEAQHLFVDAGLELIRAEVPDDSHPARSGRELLALFRKPI